MTSILLFTLTLSLHANGLLPTCLQGRVQVPLHLNLLVAFLCTFQATMYSPGIKLLPWDTVRLDQDPRLPLASVVPPLAWKSYCITLWSLKDPSYPQVVPAALGESSSCMKQLFRLLYSLLCSLRPSWSSPGFPPHKTSNITEKRRQTLGTTILSTHKTHECYVQKAGTRRSWIYVLHSYRRCSREEETVLYILSACCYVLCAHRMCLWA